tara:strand:- start:9184 stop:10821 length:1638 start_codon:yes stop_codon:yes gene_type:complete
MAESKSTQSFYPQGNIAGQAVNDFIGLQGERVAKDTLLQKQQQAVQVAEAKAQGDLQKEQMKQYAKVIENQRKAQEAQRASEQKMLNELPINDGGMFRSHSDPILGMTDQFSSDYGDIIESKGMDYAVSLSKQIDAFATQLGGLHGKNISKGFALQGQSGRAITGKPGMVEAYDDVMFQNNMSELNTPGRFEGFIDENYNLMVRDTQGGQLLPAEEWTRGQLETVGQSFISQPKLNYNQTVDELFSEQTLNDKGSRRIPGYATNTARLENFFETHFEGDKKEEDPIFMTAISQHAISQGIPVDQVLGDVSEMDVAVQEFKEDWTKRMTDLVSSEPAKKTGSSKATGEEVVKSEGFEVMTQNSAMLEEAKTMFMMGEGSIDNQAEFMTGVAQMPSGVLMQAPDFLPGITDKDGQITVKNASFSDNGNLYLKVSGTFNTIVTEGDPLIGIDPVTKPGVDSRGTVLQLGDANHTEALQAIGGKLLNDTESKEVQKFYDGLDGFDQAAYYVGLIALSKGTNPEFEKRVKQVVGSLGGVDYDKLQAELSQ